MTSNIPLSQIVFVDIETTAQSKRFEDLSEHLQHLWAHKMRFELEKSELSAEELYNTRAGIFAEFGKIVCITVGLWQEKKSEFALKSYFGDDERQILTQFADMCQNLQKRDGVFSFCGHNIREFDIPYISRRMLVLGIPIPKNFNFQDQKPWNSTALDTLQYWKFGDYKHFVSLDLLAAIFGLESPKTHMDGSRVNEEYWQNSNLHGIVQYCEKDVETLIRLYLKMTQNDLETFHFQKID